MGHKSEPLWELVGITKEYPGVRANDGISLKLYPGEIHALLGENGCGKSTLIKILSGVVQPTSGEIRFQGQKLVLEDPTAARCKGVATVFQEFSLVPTLTVAENIFLGRCPLRRGLIDWGAMRAESERVLREMDIALDPEKLVMELSVAEQQLVEIAKAVSIDAKLMILDEPTTALGQHEIESLHDLLRKMKKRGVAILYISHRLDEVVGLVDSATILRNGKVVSSAAESTLDVDDIVSKMVGASVKEHYPKERNATDQVVFEALDLVSDGGAEGATFDVRRGEVFGLGGVIGSGRTEIARALFGADRIVSGGLRINDRTFVPKTPRDAIKAGLALIPENRKFDGLFFNFFGGENITSAALKTISPSFILDKRHEDKVCKDYIGSLEITPAATEKFVNMLSGGNQQKIVIARWLFARSQILIMDEPTQGIDIGAKVAVYKLINELTRQGKSVILISSDHNELLAMSDRIGIVREGRVVETRNAREVDVSHLVQASAQIIHHEQHEDDTVI